MQQINIRLCYLPSCQKAEICCFSALLMLRLEPYCKNFQNGLLHARLNLKKVIFFLTSKHIAVHNILL